MRNFSDNRIIVHESNTSTPLRITVDWLGNNVYWTDDKNGCIEVINLDGRGRMKLVEQIRLPWSLVVFPKQGYLFWLSWDQKVNRIERATLDGKSRKAIISGDLGLPNGLTIDYDSNKLYWADAIKNRIEMADLNGRYRVQLIPHSIKPYGLTLVSD